MYKKIFALMAMTLILCGCIKIETDITINKDGSTIVKDRFMMSKQLLALANQDPLAEKIQEKQAQGKEIIPYETEEMKGFETKTVIKNLATDKWNIITENEAIKTNNPDQKFVSVKKGMLKTTYNIDAEFDMTKDSENATDKAQIAAMKASGMDVNNLIQYKYIIHTPTKPDTHNANYANEQSNTYTWDIKFDGVTTMKMKLTIYNTINIAIVAIIALIFLIGIVSPKIPKL